ncbi:MAG TPA: sigma-70 family RNA polymerase sigma factor [Gemmatimonadales bacterium]|nr:sigma-70 family RNA polymerase sigma factor [Gemmatimonadales bacterium]
MTAPKRLSQEEEQTLIRRLKARDERALGELYDALAPWVLGVAHRILQDDGEAEDVLGDVFVQVWTHIEQHDPARGPLAPWILSIARNRALDAVRRRRRWWRKAERWGEARSRTDGAVVPPPDPAEAAVPGWPVHQEVHAALGALPEEQRRLVLLAYFEGLTHSEIARRTGQPLGTVKTRLRIAHGKLAETLKHVKDWLR